MTAKKMTAFYVESLLLVGCFIAVILIVTSVFGKSRAMSEEAKILTSSVMVSENAAEIFQSHPDEAFMRELLDEENLSESENGFALRYDAEGKPDALGTIELRISVSDGSGTLRNLCVTAVKHETGKEIFRIETSAASRKGGME